MPRRHIATQPDRQDQTAKIPREKREREKVDELFIWEFFEGYRKQENELSSSSSSSLRRGAHSLTPEVNERARTHFIMSQYFFHFLFLSFSCPAGARTKAAAAAASKCARDSIMNSQASESVHSTTTTRHARNAP